MNPPADDLIHLHEEHVTYLKELGAFQPECSCDVFNNEQIELLKMYGHWFKALAERILEPFTHDQRRFVEAANGITDPVSIAEKTWFIYIKRSEYFQKHPDLGNVKYKLDGDEFYNRDDAARMRGRMYGTINQTHSQGMQTATFGRYPKG